MARDAKELFHVFDALTRAGPYLPSGRNRRTVKGIFFARSSFIAICRASHTHQLPTVVHDKFSRFICSSLAFLTNHLLSAPIRFVPFVPRNLLAILPRKGFRVLGLWLETYQGFQLSQHHGLRCNATILALEKLQIKQQLNRKQQGPSVIFMFEPCVMHTQRAAMMNDGTSSLAHEAGKHGCRCRFR